MGKEKNSPPSSSSNNGTTPICRCRVMYLGSSVPHATKDGLQGIQEPLRDLYPETGLVDYGSAGIDSWISVWSNGILIENVDDSGREVKRFFPIESLHYCAAVRYVVIPSTTASSNSNNTLPPQQPPPPPPLPPQSTINSVTNNQATINNHNANHHHHESMESKTNNNSDKVAKFLPLDSPFLRNADNNHPPLFACILRRTTGIKVLECHAFICKREPAANALVRCCFHAYADSMYAKQIEENPYSNIGNNKRSRSISALDMVDKSDSWSPPDNNHHNNHHHQQQNNHIRDISDDLPPPPPPHNHHHHNHNNHHQSNGHHHHNDHHQAPSEIGAASTVSHSPDEENYTVTNGNKAWPGHGPGPGAGHGYVIREGPMSTMRPGMMKPRQMIYHHHFMGPPGGPPPQMVPGHHPPLPPPPGAMLAPGPMFGIPMTIGDHEKFLKHSLKKKKKKSKSKMNGFAGGGGGSLLIGPPPPLPPGSYPSSAMMGNGIPVNFVQVPQISPQGSGHHHHHHHPQHHAIYAPTSTAYSVRSGLRRGGGGPGSGAILPPPSAEYPIMFATNDQEPVYIPPMRPLTPLSNYHQHHHQQHHSESHYVQYPIQSYGTTPRRDKVRSSKDRSARGEDTERESSPSNVGIYKRKGHLNERAFSYSIRQEHRSRSNSLANLQFDDGVSCSGDGGVGDHRQNSSNMVDPRERSSNHSSGHFERNGGNGNGNNGHGLLHRDNSSRESFNDYRSEIGGLSQSLANLNVGGNTINSNGTEAKNVPKTASIKRSKQRNSLGSKGMPIAPPVPPSQAPGMVNGKSSSHSQLEYSNKAANNLRKV